MKQKIIWFSLALVLTCGIFTIYISQRFLNEAKEKVVLDVLTVADSLRSALASEFFLRYGDIRSFALNKAIEAQDRVEISSALNSYVNLYGVYDLLLYVDANGNYIASNTRSFEGKLLNIEALKSSDFTQQSWFKRTIAEDFSEDKEKKITGAVFDDVAEDPVSSAAFGESRFSVGFSTIIKDSWTDEIKGVLTARTNLRWIEHEFDIVYQALAKKGAKSTKMTLVNSQGYLLYEFDGAEKTESAKSAGILQRNLRKESISAALELARGKSGTYDFRDTGNSAEYFAGYMPVTSPKFLDSIGWGIIVTQNGGEALTKLSNLKWTALVVSLLFLLLSGIISVAVVRSILRPLTEVTSVVSKISSGDFSRKIEVTSTDELGILGNAVNLMSKRIEKTQSNFESLLAGLSEGVFFFDETGNLSRERSKSVSKVLPGSENCSTIFEVMGKFAQKDQAVVKGVLNLIWNSDDDFFSDFDSTVSFLGNQYTIGSGGGARHVCFSFKELLNEQGKIDKVITIVCDITDNLKNKKELEIQAERVKRIATAASRLDSYAGFQGEINKLLHLADKEFERSGEKSDKRELKRLIHTLKGNLATHSYKSLANKLHTLEDYVQEFGTKIDEISHLWREIKTQWKSESYELEVIFSLSQRDSHISIPRKKIEALQEYIAASGDQTLKLLQNELYKVPLDQLVGKHILFIENLADRRKTKKVSFELESNGQDFNPADFSRIDDAIGHIIRNCFDHGIEDFRERVANGKPEAGTIRIGCSEKDSMISLMISDDGKGIDRNRLAKKAVDAGIWTEAQAAAASEKQIDQLIFSPGISTASVITDISGRGVGMDAARECVLNLGGTMTVTSNSGIGATFTITIPVVRRLTTFDEIAA